MKTVPRCRPPHQAVTASDSHLRDDTIGTQKQLNDEMSVDLVIAQMAEAWQV